jgi:signal transduction histidine kinase
MSSGILRRALKKTSFRLTWQFSLIFMISTVLLFSITYVLLSSSLKREDQERIRLVWIEFWARYQQGGEDALRGDIQTGESLEGKRPFFLRLANGNNQTLFTYIPDRWHEFNLLPLEELAALNRQTVLRLRAPGHGYELEVETGELQDGSILQLGMSTEERYIILSRFRNFFILVTIPLLVVSIVGGFISAFRTLRPIKNLVAAVKAVGETGEMDIRVPSRGAGDELDELAELFNHMLQRIDSLVRGMREALDNVAHDLRTPLTRMRGQSELALQSSPRDQKEALSDCIRESSRILTTLNTLMDISEAETGVMVLSLEETDLTAVIVDMAELYRYVAEERGVSLEVDVKEEIVARVDANRLKQALSNLLDNAFKYTPAGGKVALAACIEKQRVQIAVSDTGIGIAKEEQERIWDRLYRISKSRSRPGLGLGLSLVRAIITAHGGMTRVESEPGVGSRFLIDLPIRPPSPISSLKGPPGA